MLPKRLYQLSDHQRFHPFVDELFWCWVMIELRNDPLQNIKYFTNKINSHRQNYINYENRNTEEVEDECALRTVREGCRTTQFINKYRICGNR